MERIYVVGFMGAGKTSVGRALSRKLGWSFSDLDQEIEKTNKITVQEIFKRFGEPHFRQLERDHLRRLSTKPNTVVALGGGAYIDPENRQLAESSGLTVWLKASFETIRQRVKIDGSRPLFDDNDRAARLYAERTPFYEMARLHVIVDGLTADAVAAQIVAQLGHLQS
jgi:shikimate kinase